MPLRKLFNITLQRSRSPTGQSDDLGTEAGSGTAESASGPPQVQAQEAACSPRQMSQLRWNSTVTLVNQGAPPPVTSPRQVPPELPPPLAAQALIEDEALNLALAASRSEAEAEARNREREFSLRRLVDAGGDGLTDQAQQIGTDRVSSEEQEQLNRAIAMSLAAAQTDGTPPAISIEEKVAEALQLTLALAVSKLDTGAIKVDKDSSSSSSGSNQPTEPAQPAEQVSNELQCPICLEMFNKATTLGCGHTFCAVCLQQARSKQNGKCPMCRAAIKSVTPCVALDNIVQSLVPPTPPPPS